MSENNALNSLKENEKNTILACEIAGYLHDLGKLHPGFADEKLLQNGTKNKIDIDKDYIKEAHGTILEKNRFYPAEQELSSNKNLGEVLNCLLENNSWKKVLNISNFICLPNTVQANGLGMALRQHHVTNIKSEKHPTGFLSEELSLLGDLYTFCADIRDSALDKGSVTLQNSLQNIENSEIINTFGLKIDDYSKNKLENSWKNVIKTLHELLTNENATNNVSNTRYKVLEKLKNDFLNALGETRRPTNDVPLQNHAYSTASFFKAAVAEGFLRQNFKLWQEQKSGLFDLSKLGLIRFRLLGIRWNWQQLIKGLLSPVAMISLSEKRREVIEKLQELFEQKAVIGNLIYKDDNGALFLLPGFYEGSSDDNKKQAEVLFQEKVLTNGFKTEIDAIIAELGTGTAYNLYWTEPTLYLTDYAEALGLKNNVDNERVLYRQANENALRELWNQRNNNAKNLQHICPQCGIRPATTFEFDYNQSKVKEQPLCDKCTLLSNDEAREKRKLFIKKQFSFEPKSLDLSDLVTGNEKNSRIAIFSLQVDAEQIANGNALITQLAQPFEEIKKYEENGKSIPDVEANEFGNKLQNLINKINENNPKDSITKQDKFYARKVDPRWFASDDARNKYQLIQDFFLRESADLPEQLKLVRHDGDRLALFAMRKHPSPARLQRLWEDLHDLWKKIITELGKEFETEIIPLSLDSSGFRFVVAANNSTIVVQKINSKLQQSLNKLKGSLAVHLSCIVTNSKFPFYLALETLNKMESRIKNIRYQNWKLLENSTENNGFRKLTWETFYQGVVDWEINIKTSDENQDDIWHSYFILNKRDGEDFGDGPNRLVHITDLKANDEVLIMPSTFDFMALEGTARRHQLYYTLNKENNTLGRPHWVMGEKGCTPLLLDTFNDFVNLVKLAGWDDGDSNYGKAKRLAGEMVETYEKWVRDVPESLRKEGKKAWESHLKNMLNRYCPKVDKMAKENILATIKDGRFFDALEWLTFIGK